jgi:hypothetical protein
MKLSYLLAFPLAILLSPGSSLAASFIGNATEKADYFEFSTGSKSKAASTISKSLGVALPKNFTEGSGFKVETPIAGIYEFDWWLETSETDGDDVFFAWGDDMKTVATSAAAKKQVTKTKKSTQWWQTFRIDTSTGAIAFMVMDTTDKNGTTTVRIKDIRHVPEPSPLLGLLLLATLRLKTKNC